MGVTESRLLATLPAEKGLTTGLNYSGKWGHKLTLKGLLRKKLAWLMKKPFFLATFLLAYSVKCTCFEKKVEYELF